MKRRKPKRLLSLLLVLMMVLTPLSTTAFAEESSATLFSADLMDEETENSSEDETTLDASANKEIMLANEEETTKSTEIQSEAVTEAVTLEAEETNTDETTDENETTTQTETSTETSSEDITKEDTEKVDETEEETLDEADLEMVDENEIMLLGEPGEEEEQINSRQVTATQEIPITSVKITNCVLPKLGESCDTSEIKVTTSPTNATEIVDIHWRDKNNSNVPKTDDFEEDELYFLYIELEPKPGYSFEIDDNNIYTGMASFDNVQASSALGKTSSDPNIKNLVISSKQYIANDFTTVSMVTVTNAIPEVGKSCSTDDIKITTVPEDARYSIRQFFWRDYSLDKVLTSEDKFEEGRTYQLFINLESGKNTWFNSFDSAATINGKEPSPSTRVITIGFGDSMLNNYFIYSKPMLAKESPIAITNVDITGVTEPVAGARPSYSYKVSTTPKDAADKKSDFGIDGMRWYKYDGSLKEMKPTDTFEEGGIYQVEIAVTPATSDPLSSARYYFDNENNGVTNYYYGRATINGKGVPFKPAVANREEKWLSVRNQYTVKTCVAPTITTSSLPDGTDGTLYNQTITATGDTPIIWEIESGSLPDGLELDDDVISGTPTEVGTSTFTVKATNSVGSVSKTLSITINASSPTITTNYSLPNGNIGEEYNQTLEATGTAPITWSIESGSLPAGLILDPNTGAISGTPTASGSSNFTVKATNSAGSASKELNITVNIRIIHNAAATVTTPVAGANPDLAPVSGNSSVYDVKVDYWYLNEEPYTHLAAGDAFVGGKNYNLRLKFTAKNGYSFLGTTEFTINGKPTKAYDTIIKAYREITFSVPATATPLTGTLKITGDAEYNGQLKAKFDGTLPGKSTYQWRRGSTEIGENSIFYVATEEDIGNVITCEVTSDTLPGVVISNPVTIEKRHQISPTVNVVNPTEEGEKGKIEWTDETMEYASDLPFSDAKDCSKPETIVEPGTYYIRFKETKTHKVGESTKVTIKAPRVLNNLPVKVFVPTEGAYPTNLAYKPQYTEYYSNEIEWREVTEGIEGKKLDQTTDTFEAGKTYRFRLTLRANSNSIIGKAAALTLNGNAVNIEDRDNKFIKFYYDFTVPAATGIDVPLIVTDSLPNGTVGTTYSQTINATSSEPLTWTIESGSLPEGLTLDKDTGVISGLPTKVGTATFEVKATNSNGSGVRLLSIKINPAPVVAHTYGEWVETKAPTCTEKGERVRKCTDCGLEEKEEIEALGHDYAKIWSNDAVNHWHKCTRCDDMADVAAHIWNEESATEDHDKHCTVCEYVAAAQLTHTHNGTLVPAKEPTFKANGNKAYYTCDCGIWFEDAACTIKIEDHSSVIIPMLEYAFTAGDGGVYTKGSGKTLEFTSNGPKDDCTGIKIDGTVIDAENYTLESGSTIITLKNAYLETLSEGEHDIAAVYGEREATAKFKVLADDPTYATDTTIEIPIYKTVVQGGTVAPEARTFEFVVTPYGNPGADLSSLSITGTSIETNGTNNYIGTIWISGDLDVAKNARGLRITEKNDGAANWSYDTAAYIVYPDIGNGMLIQKDMGTDINQTEVRIVSFTNTYTKIENQILPPANQNNNGSTEANTETDTEEDTEEETEAKTNGNKKGNTSGNTNSSSNGNTGGSGLTASPKTGDNSHILLWIAVLFVSFGGIVTTFFVRKKRGRIK